MSRIELLESLKKLPCMLHGNKTTQTVLSYNEKTGTFKVKCDKCAQEGLNNVLTGTIKKNEQFKSR